MESSTEPAELQPMHSACGRFTLVFNGTIYNHQDIRRGLRLKAWRGNSDTETLLEGLAQRGTSLLLDLRGMFSFALHDSETGSLLLARDRIGLKPLYLQRRPGELCFASDLRVFGEDTFKLTPLALSQYMNHGYFSVDKELGEGLELLSPGTLLHVYAKGKEKDLRWWPPQPRTNWTLLPIRRHSQALHLVHNELERAVAEHLPTDATVTCLLTSDLSTRILAALAAKQVSTLLQTVSIRFFNTHSQNCTPNQEVSRYLSTNHCEINLDEDTCLNWFWEAIECLTFPSIDAISQYIIYKAVSQQGVRVILVGLGGSEIFGKSSGCQKISHQKTLNMLINNILPNYRYNFLQNISPNDICYSALTHYLLTSDKELKTAGLPPIGFSGESNRRLTKSYEQVAWSKLFGYTEPCLLRDNSQICTSLGLALIMPFLDHRLLELILRLPQEFQHGWRKKTILQLIGERLLPIKTINHKNQYLDLPMADWLRGPLNQKSRAVLADLGNSELINKSYIDNLWMEFEVNGISWGKILALIIIEKLRKNNWINRSQII